MSDFSLDVANFAKAFEDGAEKAIRGTVIQLSASFVDSSPVDTGRFRANWFLTGQQQSAQVTASTDPSGAKTKQTMEGKALSIKDWSVFTITNNLPYANVIEYGGYGDGPLTTAGFSKQAPQGVVRVNIKRFNQLLEKEARRLNDI